MEPIKIDPSQPVALSVEVDGVVVPIPTEVILIEARKFMRTVPIAELQVGDATLPITQADAQRFHSYVVLQDSGCMEWVGGEASKAKFSIQGKNLRANRVAYQMHYGDLNSTYQVRSTCEGTRCVNPRHLYQAPVPPPKPIEPKEINLEVARLMVGGVEKVVRSKDVGRFWAKVQKLTEEECWLWQGKRLPKGYGQFSLEGTYVGAHRISYLLEVGPLDPEMEIDHYECDNPPCVNPSHLRQVTPEANGSRIRRRSLNPQ